MAKQAGMGDNCYVDGFDLSGDVGSLEAIGGGNEPLVDTGIDKFAMERLGGKRDGRIEFTSYFNDATSPAAEHSALKTMPTTDRIVSYFRGTALGSEGASLVSKQIGYDGTRGDDGSLTFKVAAQANGFGLEWGQQLTAGRDGPFTTSAQGTGLDYGAAIGATNFGLQAYLHVFAITSGTAAIEVQDSNDNGVDPWAVVTGAAFGVVAAGGYRVATGPTENVKRWLRWSLTGNAVNIEFALVVVRNMTAVVF